MRTSKRFQESERILRSLNGNSASRRPEANAHAQAVENRNAENKHPESTSDSELSDPPSDIGVEQNEELGLSKRKRKRANHDSTTELPSSAGGTAAGDAEVKHPKKARRAPAKKVKKEGSDEVKVEPPPGWEAVYNTTKEMRSKILAPVDTMGCERLAQTEASPRDQRFQTLIALMLSSQTKDTVTAVAMKRLQTDLPGGLNLESVLAVSPTLLNELIMKVGFHNLKTTYIKKTAEILQREYNSDIPDTIKGLVSLPGVGPKMAHLTMSAAWGRTEGIGVDVHVHRITNLWGWHKTKGPEETRMTLEAWLPKDKWHEINHLLVGFGQTVCLPVGRRCGECDLATKGICPSAVFPKATSTQSRKAKGKAAAEIKIEVDLGVENPEVKIEDADLEVHPQDIEDLGTRAPVRSTGRKR